MGDAPPTITTEQRDAWLRMNDAMLLADCQVDAYRASGPGGQKRNKTSSAVRLRHGPSGQSAISEESRSQHSNKRNALRRLRLVIAIDVRCPPAEPSPLPALFGPCVMSNGRLRVSPKNTEYPLLMAHVLDEVVAAGGSVREAAQAVGVSTSQLVRFIASDHTAFARVNGIRSRTGLPRLRMQ